MNDLLEKEQNERHRLEMRLNKKQLELRRSIRSWKGDVVVVASLYSHAHLHSDTKEIKRTLKEVAEGRKKLAKEFTKILKKYNATLADVKKVLTKEEWSMLTVPPKYQKEKERLDKTGN